MKLGRLFGSLAGPAGMMAGSAIGPMGSIIGGTLGGALAGQMQADEEEERQRRTGEAAADAIRVSHGRRTGQNIPQVRQMTDTPFSILGSTALQGFEGGQNFANYLDKRKAPIFAKLAETQQELKGLKNPFDYSQQVQTSAAPKNPYGVSLMGEEEPTFMGLKPNFFGGK